MKQDLDRAMRVYSPPPDAFERMMKRRDRRRKASRVKAGGVGLAIALAGTGIAFIAFRGSGTEVQPADRSADAPTNGRIAFARRLPGRWNLFTVNPDGSDERQVTSGVRDYSSSWSPDGTKLAVDTERGLTVMNADGSDPVTIAPAGEGSFPSWAPDGTQILFTRVDQSGPYVRTSEGASVLPSHIYSIKPDGSGEQQLTSGRYADYGGSWSPDGSRVVFSRQALGDDGLYVMDADGSNVTRISVGRDADPAWAPDGLRIAFSRWTNNEATICTMSPDGSNVEELTTGSRNFDTSPAWSPDGSKITFTRYVSGKGSEGGHIYLMGADGRGVVRLTAASAEEQVPSWGTAPVTPG
jgi:TolB protein